MNFFVTEEMPLLFFNKAEELAEYLQQVEDHYLKNDYTFHCYKNDNGRFVYWANYNGETNDYLTISGLCRIMNITFPMYFGYDQRRPKTIE